MENGWSGKDGVLRLRLNDGITNRVPSVLFRAPDLIWHHGGDISCGGGGEGGSGQIIPAGDKHLTRLAACSR